MGGYTPRGAGSRRRWWWVRAATLATAAVLMAGCGSATPGSDAGSLAASGLDLTGQTITVGGRGEFAEQKLLCRIQVNALRAVGATVNDRCDITGSDVARGDLLAGRIDMYWSYTGTGWAVDLGRTTPIRDPAQQYAATRDADAANGIVWTAPTPFDDTYAIATTPEVAARYRLRTISDFANLVDAGSPDATLCVEPGFATRPDSLPGLGTAYGITGRPGVTVLDADGVYQATANGKPCAFGEVFSTDGRIAGLNLVTLVDDRAFFPAYNASNTIRRQVVDRAPAVATVSDEIARRLDEATMLGLNGRISSQGVDPDVVARDWLAQQGLIGRQ